MDLFVRVEDALRALAGYHSESLEHARRRGAEAEDIRRYYFAQWWRALELADEVHDLRPDAVTATGGELSEARRLVDELRARLDRMKPASPAPAERDAWLRRVFPDRIPAPSQCLVMDEKWRGGQPRYGQRLTGGEIVDDPDELHAIALMIEWRRQGLSLRQIVERLDAAEIPARRGHWHPQTVARIVDQPHQAAS